MKGTRKWDIMAEKNHVVHRNNRRLVNSLYTTSALIESEPYVDSTIQHFMDKLRDRTNERLDLGVWVQLFAFGMKQAKDVTMEERLTNLHRRDRRGHFLSKIWLAGYWRRTRVTENNQTCSSIDGLGWKRSVAFQAS